MFFWESGSFYPVLDIIIMKTNLQFREIQHFFLSKNIKKLLILGKSYNFASNLMRFASIRFLY